MAKNDNLNKARDAKNDEFYISSSLKLLSFESDDNKNKNVRKTSKSIEGGAF